MKIENSKVYRVLKRLSKREKEQLRLFLESPFFNKRQDVVLLFEQLILERKQAIVPQELFAIVYPKRVFKEQDLRLVLSYLFRLVEHFLVYQQLFQEDKKASHKRAALQAYQNLQLPKFAEKSLKAYQQQHEKSRFRHANFYLEAFALHSEHYEFSLTARPFERQAFEEMSETLDTAYISLKLRQACHALSNQHTYRHEYELNMIPELIRYVQANELQSTLAIGVYYYIYSSLTEENAQAAFQHLLQLLPQADTTFPPRERRDIYLMLINHYIRQLNKEGGRLFAQQIFELYKQGLQSDSLLENDTLSRFTYCNIVRSALKVQALDWAEDFIHTYQPKLDKQFRQNYFSFNMALVSYAREQAQGSYDRALGYLLEAKNLNVGLELNARTLRLKIYYELGEWESLDSHMNTMRSFIKRHNLNETYRKNYTNIINYTKRMCALKPYDDSKRAALIERIQAEKILTERTWFLEQLQ